MSTHFGGGCATFSLSLSHLDIILCPPVPDLDEDECEVVDEEERVGEAEGELDEARVRHVLLLAVGQVASKIRKLISLINQKYIYVLI